ncbi:Flp pilus assembly protein CpaB [Nocardioides campestrisoli]|uniref:Flp pilus assembly protein CpaB n=1 Tax=Nocardioides campestrisoli TaxID=2736757 RepID=UPI0015E711D5|nr:Flp pilus assembly protein CpaB [Nocardioides campestrisoli]
MDRRKLLLVVAVVVALFGTALVYLYVESADNRAAEQYDTVEVLTAVSPIVTGETIADAANGGKIQRQSLPRNTVLPSAVTTIDSLEGLAANTNIYPGEQIVPEKFGGVGESSALPIPNGKLAVSVQLTDTARVSGFVSAGSDVAVWLNGTGPEGQPFTRLLLPEVKVLAAGSTTLVSTTSTDQTGAETTEQLPRTLLTLAVDQAQAEKLMFAATNGELSFGLRTGTTKIAPNPGTNLQNLFS